MIHDGARPFIAPSLYRKRDISHEMFDAIIHNSSKDTIKVISKEGFVVKTTLSETLCGMFRHPRLKFDLISKAYKGWDFEETLRI